MSIHRETNETTTGTPEQTSKTAQLLVKASCATVPSYTGIIKNVQSKCTFSSGDRYLTNIITLYYRLTSASFLPTLNFKTLFIVLAFTVGCITSDNVMGDG